MKLEHDDDEQYRPENCGKHATFRIRLARVVGDELKGLGPIVLELARQRHIVGTKNPDEFRRIVDAHMSRFFYVDPRLLH